MQLHSSYKYAETSEMCTQRERERERAETDKTHRETDRQTNGQRQRQRDRDKSVRFRLGSPVFLKSYGLWTLSCDFVPHN